MLAFNLMETEAGCSNQMVQGGPDEPQITGPAPTLVDLIGEEAAVPTLSNQVRIPDGGRYLNPQWAELLEEVLWMNLETTKKKREWRDWSITEQKAAKKAKGDTSIHGTRRNTHQGDQGKGTSTGAGTASPSANAPACMEVDDEDRPRAKDIGSSKVGEQEDESASKRVPKKK
ncbi:uncharacterized protein EDB91DRAFT_1250403 [Suillus paluster]|uniref:uncharacterized protein n=1 Tax=Suillus paluster TaxID=48578 RepID=UPI001B8710C1|nr:uncharacterized protein EDB91DRAFT_1250403 [Suillus paluster]KAG1735572.1 hypothetical protein EDB91DRAFT_1250403 [Suillus paluster]